MSPKAASITLRLPTGTHCVEIAPHGAMLLERALRHHPGRWALVTDAHVWAHVWEHVARHLAEAGHEVPDPIVIPPGEGSKRLGTLSRVLQQLLRRNLERNSCLVALGGGVVTDLAGMAAATYMRGISWLAVPTSLLGMVDAAVGGKVGVDLLRTKNAVGCFHQPSRVLAGTNFLDSLPERERRNGLAEIVKYAMIADRRLFERLETCRASALGRSPEADVELVARCVRIKARIVEEDPLEHHQRAALNFGHTVGHALEAQGRGRLLHGEAVALGMLVACALAETCGVARQPLRRRLATLLHRLGLPTRADTPVSVRALQGHLRRDKKSRGGAMRFVLTPRIGSVSIGHEVPMPLLEEALQVIAPASRNVRHRAAGKGREG